MAQQSIACGFWHLKDLEHDRSIQFMIHQAKQTTAEKGTEQIFSYIYRDGKRYTKYLKRTKVEDQRIKQKGDRIYISPSAGNHILNFTNDTLIVNQNKYFIEVKQTGQERNDMFYTINVYKDGKLVAESKNAMSFVFQCMESYSDPENKEDCLEETLNDMKYRIVFYLIWRDIFDTA
jgi:hypothetical protein